MTRFYTSVIPRKKQKCTTGKKDKEANNFIESVKNMITFEHEKI